MRAEEERLKGIFKRIFTFIGLFLFFSCIVTVNRVTGASMEPAVRDGGISITNRLSYVFRAPKRGDIITFDHEESVLIKRVIGIPGDRVAFRDGCVYINGTAVEETYLRDGTKTACDREFSVPDDCVLVMGDNREMSVDSRDWAAPYVHRERILGQVMLLF